MEPTPPITPAAPHRIPAAAPPRVERPSRAEVAVVCLFTPLFVALGGLIVIADLFNRVPLIVASGVATGMVITVALMIAAIELWRLS